MKLIAIDPGVQGGIAWNDELGAQCCKMPETVNEIVDQLRTLAAEGYTTAYLEQVVGFIPGAGAGGMFTFGQSFGQIQGALAALNFRVIEVRPAKWQKDLSLGKKSDHGKKWKGHLKDVAQKLFPFLKVTLKNCDALLLLWWATDSYKK